MNVIRNIPFIEFDYSEYKRINQIDYITGDVIYSGSETSFIEPFSTDVSIPLSHTKRYIGISFQILYNEDHNIFLDFDNPSILEPKNAYSITLLIDKADATITPYLENIEFSSYDYNINYKFDVLKISRKHRIFNLKVAELDSQNEIQSMFLNYKIFVTDDKFEVINNMGYYNEPFLFQTTPIENIHGIQFYNDWKISTHYIYGTSSITKVSGALVLFVKGIDVANKITLVQFSSIDDYNMGAPNRPILTKMKTTFDEDIVAYVVELESPYECKNINPTNNQIILQVNMYTQSELQFSTVYNVASNDISKIIISDGSIFHDKQNATHKYNISKNDKNELFTFKKTSLNYENNNMYIGIRPLINIPYDDTANIPNTPIKIDPPKPNPYKMNDLIPDTIRTIWAKKVGETQVDNQIVIQGNTLYLPKAMTYDMNFFGHKYMTKEFLDQKMISFGIIDRFQAF